MVIVYTDEYRTNSKNRLGITEEMVEYAVNSRPRVMELGDKQARIYLKKIKGKESYLLVISEFRKAEDNLYVYSAYIILPSLFDSSPTYIPIRALQQLVLKFGFPITIGDKTEKFIYEASIPINNQVSIKNDADIVKILKIDIPKDHEVDQAMYMYLEENNGQKCIKCALVYSIDLTEYNKWLNQQK